MNSKFARLQYQFIHLTYVIILVGCSNTLVQVRQPPVLLSPEPYISASQSLSVSPLPPAPAVLSGMWSNNSLTRQLSHVEFDIVSRGMLGPPWESVSGRETASVRVFQSEMHSLRLVLRYMFQHFNNYMQPHSQQISKDQ